VRPLSVTGASVAAGWLAGTSVVALSSSLPHEATTITVANRVANVRRIGISMVSAKKLNIVPNRSSQIR
jgi:hypothetical protein